MNFFIDLSLVPKCNLTLSFVNESPGYLFATGTSVTHLCHEGSYSTKGKDPGPGVGVGRVRGTTWQGDRSTSSTSPTRHPPLSVWPSTRRERRSRPSLWPRVRTGVWLGSRSGVGSASDSISLLVVTWVWVLLRETRATREPNEPEPGFYVSLILRSPCPHLSEVPSPPLPCTRTWGVVLRHLEIWRQLIRVWWSWTTLS